MQLKTKNIFGIFFRWLNYELNLRRTSQDLREEEDRELEIYEDFECGSNGIFVPLFFRHIISCFSMKF
jgi:hypothetical protein